MSVEVIHCPNCAHKLRLPFELLGQTVQCPMCATQFVAPAVATASPPVLRLADAAPPPPPVGGISARIVPGVFLLIIGLLGVALDGGGLLMYQFKPEWVLPQLPQNQGIDPLPVFLVAHILGLLVSGLTCLGALALLAGRAYPLAVVGTIAAMLNCPNLCCLLGLPIGLWALFTLLQPAVQAEFNRPS